MQVFDITIAANGSRIIDVLASYIYYLNGSAGGADTTISFRPATGSETVYLKPGQAYKIPANERGLNSRWIMTNLKNEGTIIGQVMMGEGEFSDNRISGSVEVVDGGKARTMASTAYMFTAARAAYMGLMGHLQLWNPVGSAKNVMVEKLMLATTGTTGIGMGFHNTQLSTSIGNVPQSKRSSGGVASQIVCYAQENATALAPGVSMAALADKTLIQLTAPLCIEPGNGLVFRSGINQDFQVTLELFEESR